MPGRWAAPPAPAMITFSPRSRALGGIAVEPLRGAMRRDDLGLVRDFERVEHRGRRLERRPVGAAAHDDADDGLRQRSCFARGDVRRARGKRGIIGMGPCLARQSSPFCAPRRLRRGLEGMRKWTSMERRRRVGRDADASLSPARRRAARADRAQLRHRARRRCCRRFLNIEVEGNDQTQIFRALMCLYLAASAFWAIAAFKPAWQRVAVVWAVLFCVLARDRPDRSACWWTARRAGCSISISAGDLRRPARSGRARLRADATAA